MALNHWHLIDGNIFYATDVRLCAGAWWVILDSRWLTGKVLQVKQIYTETTLLPPYCTWPCTVKDALVAECGQIEHHDHNFLQQPPQKYLFRASYLEFERAPWFFTWQRMSGRSQDVSKVIVLCCMKYKPTHKGSWSANSLYLWGWQQPAQAYRVFIMWFSIPERALTSTENFLEPQTWWVSLIKVCCHWAFLLPLSYHGAIAGKAESGPTCLCWYCLLLGVYAVSLPAFFPLSKCISLDI